MKRVAIQGFEGSYHDIATRLFFKEEETELICSETFDDYTRFHQSINAVRPLTKEFAILGEYKAFEANR